MINSPSSNKILSQNPNRATLQMILEILKIVSGCPSCLSRLKEVTIGVSQNTNQHRLYNSPEPTRGYI